LAPRAITHREEEDVPEPQRLESEACLQAESLMVMTMLAMHPRPHEVMRRFRDLLETSRHDPSDAAIIERLQARAGHVPSTLEQLLQALQPPGSHCSDPRRPE
jgi:hypothetical protein